MSAQELLRFLRDPVSVGLTKRFDWSRTLLSRVADAFPDDARRWQVSTALVGAEATHPVFHVKRVHDERPMRAIEAVREWVACPCPKHLEETRLAFVGAVEAMDSFGLFGRFLPSARGAFKAARAATLAASPLCQHE